MEKVQWMLKLRCVERWFSRVCLGWRRRKRRFFHPFSRTQMLACWIHRIAWPIPRFHRHQPKFVQKTKHVLEIIR